MIDFLKVLNPRPHMQRLMRQHRRAALCKGRFPEGFIPGKNRHVPKTIAHAQAERWHKLVHPLRRRLESIARWLVAAEFGNEVQVARPHRGIGEEMAEKLAVAELRADEQALVQPVVVVVADLEGLKQLPPLTLAVVELRADAHAEVRVFEKALEIRQADGLRKHADGDGEFCGLRLDVAHSSQ